MKIKQKLIIVIMVAYGAIITTCSRQPDSLSLKLAKVDLTEIVARNSLIVATSNNSSDYFLYKGEPLGFQLEMFEELGNYLGLKLDVMVVNDPAESLDLLQSGQCDMVANSWNLSGKNSEVIQTSAPLLNSDLVLVQRNPGDLNLHTIKTIVKNPQDLKGKTIYVPILSVQAELMHQITDEVGNIQVVELPQYT